MRRWSCFRTRATSCLRTWCAWTPRPCATPRRLWRTDPARRSGAPSAWHGARRSGVAGDTGLDDDRRAPAPVSGRGGSETARAAADAVRALRWRIPRAADDGGETASPRSAGGDRRLPRAGRRSPERRASGGRARAGAMTGRRAPWHDTSLSRLLGVRLPIFLSPMAGPSTPELAAAVSDAGGLGSLAGAPLSPDDLRAAIRRTRSLTGKPFAVNVFAPLPPPSTDGLAAWAAFTGRDPSVPPHSPWTVDDQIQVVASEGTAALSFTFGIPDVGAFAGVTIGTATTVAEALGLERHGIDVVVAQGFEA